MPSNQETQANYIPDPEQPLSTEEIKQFCTKLKSLAGPEKPEAFSGQFRGSDIDEVYLRASEHYRLEDLEVYIDTTRHRSGGGYPADSMRLVTISTAEETDNGEHLLRTRREYEMDFIANKPFYFEETRIFSAKTGRRQFSFIDQDKAQRFVGQLLKLEEEGWPEGGTETLKGSFEEEQQLNRRFGYIGFTHQRFEEAMRLLEQLGPHNRVDKSPKA